MRKIKLPASENAEDNTKIKTFIYQNMEGSRTPPQKKTTFNEEIGWTYLG